MIWSKENVLAQLAAYPAGVGRRSNEDAEIDELDNDQRNPFVRGDKPLRSAAVLVPLVNRQEGVTVLLTRRSEHLSKHAGQISFPGGRVDDTDKGPTHTALRETEEEIGIERHQIDIVGQLDDYIVGTGYLVSPIVGFIEPPFTVVPQEEEVAEIFEAPLSFVTHPENFERYTRQFDQGLRSFFAIQWNDYFIWGATAGMLRDLSQRLWNGHNTDLLASRRARR